MSSVARYTIEWQCQKCQHAQALVVRVQKDEQAAQPNPEQPHLVPDSASERHAVHMKLARRPCPKCGALDRGTLAKGIASSLFWGGALGVGAMTWMWFETEGKIPVYWFAAAPLPAVFWTWRQWTKSWKPHPRDFSEDPQA